MEAVRCTFQKIQFKYLPRPDETIRVNPLFLFFSVFRLLLTIFFHETCHRTAPSQINFFIFNFSDFRAVRTCVVFTMRRPDVSLHESGVEDIKQIQLSLIGLAIPV